MTNPSTSVLGFVRLRASSPPHRCPSPVTQHRQPNCTNAPAAHGRAMSAPTPTVPTAPPDESQWDYAAYCEFIKGEGLIPVSPADWRAFNRALDRPPQKAPGQ
jgi:hypothetical protein